MTDATGRSFLSYRRSRSAEASLLIAAQHDHGIPTWQDQRDLLETPTGDELRRILADRFTANALLWITPDVANSDVIRKIEVPGMLKRVRAEDGFFLIPVCAGGISYERAGEVVDQHLSIDNLSDWNLRKVKIDPIDAEEAAIIARHVLKRRIQAVDRQLEVSLPMQVTLHTRTRPTFRPGIGLAVDWSERFSGRETDSATWQTILLPALREVATAVRLHGGGRKVVASGLPSIPAAVALGVSFLAQAGQQICWSQYTPGRPEQQWCIAAPRETAGFIAKTTERDITAKDLAVLVSVTEDVEPAFSQTKDSLPPFRAITRIFSPDQKRFDITSAGLASDIATIVIEAMRSARQEYLPLGVVHLFMAVPVGLAMLIGQQLNTFGDIQTYEHISTDGVGEGSA
jgi:SMODS-associated and fused to various effectors sensor domain